MAAMSDYLRTTLTEHIFRDFSYPQPATIVIALCTSELLSTDTGNLTGKEVVGGGYARAVVGRGDGIWSDTVPISNVNKISFPKATSDWTGPITHVAILDNVTIGSGNLLFFGELSEQRTIKKGERLVFSCGVLSIEVN